MSEGLNEKSLRLPKETDSASGDSSQALYQYVDQVRAESKLAGRKDLIAINGSYTPCPFRESDADSGAGEEEPEETPNSNNDTDEGDEESGETSAVEMKEKAGKDADEDEDNSPEPEAEIANTGSIPNKNEIIIPTIHKGAKFNEFDHSIYERDSIEAKNYAKAKPCVVQVVALPDKNAFENVDKAKINIDIKAPGSERGCGVILSKDGLTATSSHIIDQKQSFAVKIGDDPWREARNVKASTRPYKDIAILEIAKDQARAGETFNYLKLGNSSELKKDSKVDAISIADPSNKGRSKAFISSGELVKITDSKLVDEPKEEGGPPQIFDAGMLKLSVHEEEGASGCPILNDKQEVVGLQSSITKDRKFSYAAPSDQLQESLENALKSKLHSSGRFYYTN